MAIMSIVCKFSTILVNCKLAVTLNSRKSLKKKNIEDEVSSTDLQVLKCLAF